MIDQPRGRERLRVIHCRAPEVFGGPERQILGLMELADAIGVEQELMVMGRGGGDAARARVEREFSRAAQAERYLQVFEAVLAGRRGRPKPIEEKPLRAEE